MSTLEIVLMLLGGLGLFLYAVNTLGSVLEDLAGDRLEQWMVRFAGNDFRSLLFGILITMLLDSSSAVIIIAIVLVNAGVLTLRQSIGIALGANIGTTFSSQLIALDIGMYSPIPLLLGAFMMMVLKSKKLQTAGKLLLLFGILFFGLYTMERAVEPLRYNPAFSEMMERLDHPLKGAAVGGLVTLVIQSSSATVGMVITLAKKGLIGLGASLAVMMGAELGTCSDTLLATIGGSRKALRTGVFHVLFNLVSILLGLLAFPFFVSLVERISGQAHLEQMVANGHMLFNIMGVLLAFPFIGPVSRLLEKWLPERAEKLKTMPTASNP